jgi:hypothetical protein
VARQHRVVEAIHAHADPAATLDVSLLEQRHAQLGIGRNAARGSFRELVYGEPERLYAALDLLGFEYAAMRLDTTTASRKD